MMEGLVWLPFVVVLTRNSCPQSYWHYHEIHLPILGLSNRLGSSARVQCAMIELAFGRRIACRQTVANCRIKLDNVPQTRPNAGNSTGTLALIVTAFRRHRMAGLA